ncbi:MAG: hypothetical protein JWM84_2112 [Nocardioides sp.]|nr:hypothetical protein [Nocardioides sp.]
MQTLHERLAELAELSEQRPDPGTAAMAAARGRAYRRRRLVGTAATLGASAAALALIAGISLSRSAGDVEPAPAGAPTGMPRELYEPSPWLPGTGDEPLGTLAGLVVADRASWSGTERGLVGISATTGAYRFLELPSAAAVHLTSAAISPDGGHVAYWTTGGTRLSPDTDPVTGVAIYDAATGDVVRHPVETDHGLATEELTWADDATLLLGYGQYRGGLADPQELQGSSTFAAWFTWRVGDSEPAPAPFDNGTDVGRAASGRVLEDGPPRAVVDLATMSRETVRIGSDFSQSPVPDLDGTALAWVAGGTRRDPGGGSNPNRVYVASLATRDAAGRVERRLVPGSGKTFDVLAWTDRTHVALLQRVGTSLDRTRIAVVDVRTGKSDTVTTGELGTTFAPGRVATDLLSHPPIAAPEPPSPWDPRVSTGLAATVLLTAAGFLIVWRRRARP